MPLNLKIGCCGWGYLKPSDFIDLKKLNKLNLLQTYATMFDTVEINYTFYRIPQPNTVFKWRKDVDIINPEFEFTLKAFQIITHKLRFKNSSIIYFETIREFCKTLNTEIILFQTPSTFSQKDENIKTLEYFFSNINKQNLTLVWEPRGNWERDILKEIFNKYQIVHCVDPFRDEPIIHKNQKIVYFRLHGIGKKMYSYNFTKSDLESLKLKIKQTPKSIQTIYVLFNNTNCYQDALLFKQMF